MTRVVVPRSNAPPPPSQARTTSSGTSTGAAAASTSVQNPHEDVEAVADGARRSTTEAPEAEANESPSRSSQGGVLSRMSSLRLEDSKSEGKAGEGVRETAAPDTSSATATTTVSPTLPSATSLEGPTGTSTRAPPASTRRGSFTTTSRPTFARARGSPTSSHSTSPRSHAGEGDGYNSADECSSWTSATPGFEEDEDKERHFETELRRVKGLEVRRMVPDGNCLFRSVADQVYGDPEMYAETRQMCIDYMERERDHFSQFVTESFTAYCKRKRRDKVYGNNLEIQAMAEMYNRPIHIYSYSTDPINIFHGQYETDLPPIRLSYHRRNHYNALCDPSRPTVGVGLGFGSLRGTNVDREQVKAAIRAQQDQQIDNALLAEGRYYSDLELTEQEIERMVMEKSRAEYLAQRQGHLLDETSTSAGGGPSSSGTATRNPGSPGGSQPAAPLNPTVDAAVSRNSNVRLLLSMGFNYVRVMEACSIFGDDLNNMLCYLLETDNLGENNHRMKGKAAEK